MANLFIMVGVPGSGKSTFLKKYFKNKENVKIVSRDAIRFSLVKPDEPYFSKENEVQLRFWKEINKGLAEGKNVFVDQTSLTIGARKKLLKNIYGYDKCIALIMPTSFQTSIEQNRQRVGRTCAPEEVIQQMWNNYEKPSYWEGFDAIFECRDGGSLYLVVSQEISTDYLLTL